MNKTLIALVLIVSFSESVLSQVGGILDEDLSPTAWNPREHDTTYVSPEQEKIIAAKNSPKKRYNQCQKIKQKLYDNCLLENLKTSDATSANEIRGICKRKSENIPFTTAIFYKDFYVYGFDFCDIKEDPDIYD